MSNTLTKYNWKMEKCVSTGQHNMLVLWVHNYPREPIFLITHVPTTVGATQNLGWHNACFSLCLMKFCLVADLCCILPVTRWFCWFVGEHYSPPWDGIPEFSAGLVFYFSFFYSQNILLWIYFLISAQWQTSYSNLPDSTFKVLCFFSLMKHVNC